MRKLILISICLLIVMYQIHAYNTASTEEDYLTVKWASTNVKYYISDAGSSTLTNELSIIKEAFKSWENVRTSSFTSTYSGERPTYTANALDGNSTFYFIESDWPLDATVISHTYVTYDALTGEITDADVIFNAVNYTWTDSGELNRADLQSFATHEIGHFLGLLDSDDTNATMWSGYQAGDTSARTLGTDDIAGVAFLYPKENPPQAPSAPPAGSVFLPYLINSDGAFTSYIMVQNTSSSSVSASVHAYLEDGTYAGKKDVTIPAKGRTVINPVEPSSSASPRDTAFFGQTYLDDTRFHVAVESSSISALNILGLYHALNATNSDDYIYIQPATDSGTTLSFPHYATYDPYDTFVSIVNLNANAVNATVQAYDKDGNWITQGVITVPGYGLALRPLSEVVKLGGSKLADPYGAFKIVSESGSIVGELLFISHFAPYGEGSEREFVGGSSFTQSGATTFYFPYLLNYPYAWESYILMSNTGSETVTFSMEFYDSQGTKFHEMTSQTVAPNGKYFYFISEQTFEGLTTDTAFSVKVVSDSANLRGVGAYVSINEVANPWDFVIVPATVSTSDKIYAAGATHGGNGQGYLQVTNLGSTSTTVTIKAYDDNGTLLYEGSKQIPANGLFMEYIFQVIPGYFGSTNLEITSDNGNNLAGMFVYFNSSSSRQAYAASPLVAK